MFAEFQDTLAIEDRPHFIGEVAERFDITLRTLRFWEEKGLITPDRDHARNRYYTASEVARIAFVVDCRRVGMAVDDIRDLLVDRRSLATAEFRDRVRHALERRRVEIDDEIAERHTQKQATARWIATLTDA